MTRSCSLALALVCVELASLRALERARRASEMACQSAEMGVRSKSANPRRTTAFGLAEHSERTPSVSGPSFLFPSSQELLEALSVFGPLADQVRLLARICRQIENILVKTIAVLKREVFQRPLADRSPGTVRTSRPPEERSWLRDAVFLDFSEDVDAV